MKKATEFFIAIALMSAVFVVSIFAGCSSNGEQIQTQEGKEEGKVMQKGGTEEKAGAGKLSLTDIYNFGSLHQYEYRMKTEQGTINMKYSISSDSLNGIPAWLQKSEISMQGGNAVTNTWLEKKTLKCLKIETIINVAGQEIKQESACPQRGPNAASNTKPPEIDYVGKESVAVPAGTFLADKYKGEGVLFWISKGVPLPLKIEMSEGQVVMELVSYS